MKKIVARIMAGEISGLPANNNAAAPGIYTRTVDYLNQKTVAWTPQRLKVMLIAFCLFMGSASLFVAGKAILSANGPPGILKVKRLPVPVPLRLPPKADPVLK